MPGPVQLMDRGLYNVVRSNVVVSRHRQACSLHRYPGKHTHYTPPDLPRTRATQSCDHVTKKCQKLALFHCSRFENGVDVRVVGTVRCVVTIESYSTETPVLTNVNSD
ncbi:hypothetical protein Zmor_002432 [Zophobas morio]|uniref:Uncharacterized protein n=1 Tax=Zophobas morio TaxID=2755281 RepID=A0AA38J0S8_9CUCU|nr:hypothetical protein Zmor_002432 [Zophobas morio]